MAIDAGVDKVRSPARPDGSCCPGCLRPFPDPDRARMSGCEAAFVCVDADLISPCGPAFSGTQQRCHAWRHDACSWPVVPGLTLRCSVWPGPGAVSRSWQHGSGQGWSEAVNGARLMAGVFFLDGTMTPFSSRPLPNYAAYCKPILFAPVMALVTVRDEDRRWRVGGACPYPWGATSLARTRARALAARLPAGAWD